MDIKVGDMVTRKSYNSDILFRVEEISQIETGKIIAKLKGLDVRLLADSTLDDLIKAEKGQIREYRRSFIKRNNACLKKIFARKTRQELGVLQAEDPKPDDFFEVPGRVLHIDGAEEYLELCLPLYSQLGIKAEGIHIAEKDQPASVPGILKAYQPDVLILTGHDGIIKRRESYADLDNYHNSRFFVAAVREARKFQVNKDSLIIFAGACQSHYEALLSAGANFASSPKRVLIHAFDPVFIVQKIAFTPINAVTQIDEVIDSSITGIDGIGGIETRGIHRKGSPKIVY